MIVYRDLVGFKFSNASLGKNDPCGLSTTGFLILVFGNLSAWGTKRQKTVATSSMETEYISLSRTCEELVYFSQLLKAVLHEKVTPIIFEDTQSAICSGKSEVAKSLKHLVKLHYHLVRQWYKAKI